MKHESAYDRQIIPAGGLVFQQGERSKGAYLIQSGEIEIFKCLPPDREVQLAILGPGRLFGEMALISDMPHMASARAITLTTLVLVTPEVVEMMLAKSPKLIQEMLHNLSSNLRNVTNAKLHDHVVHRDPTPEPTAKSTLPPRKPRL